MPDPQRQKLREALAAQAAARLDPALTAQAEPNFGREVVPHVVSFAGLTGALSRVYGQADEALRASPDNARFMRNDVGIMECIEQRMRLTALLPWHLEPEDDQSTEQKALCDKLTTMLGRIRRFQELRRCLMEAIWYGRYAVQYQWRRVRLGRDELILPAAPPGHETNGWLPVNGDKLVFRDVATEEDDGHPLLGPDGTPLGSVGLRVSLVNCPARLHPHLQQTRYGMAYFLPVWQRSLLTIHRHAIEDAAFEDGLGAGAIQGVGIRSRIYWEWFQKQECLAFLLDYLERSAFGVEIWDYPAGNKEAKEACEQAATKRSGPNRNVILFPRPQGEETALYDVRHVEPGMAGAQVLQELLERYFGHRIKRYILGQTLTTEADATGLGSGVADAHLDTLMQIIQYDAGNLEETLTHELVQPLIAFNFPHARGLHVRFRLDVRENDVQSKMEGFLAAYQMGARLKEADVLATIGASVPQASDRVLQQPQGGAPGGAAADGNLNPSGVPAATLRTWADVPPATAALASSRYRERGGQVFAARLKQALAREAT